MIPAFTAGRTVMKPDISTPTRVLRKTSALSPATLMGPLRGFLPRTWDHPVACDETTRRVVPWVLITGLYGFLPGQSTWEFGGMAFCEVAVSETGEVLRACLAGAGLRKVAEQAGVDRKTARRYVEAAVAAGLDRDGRPGS
jgi:hypothetical protein